jgi:hypothetical protein
MRQTLLGDGDTPVPRRHFLHAVGWAGAGALGLAALNPSTALAFELAELETKLHEIGGATPKFNIAIGSGLTHNTTGEGNLAIGQESLLENTTGLFAIAIGRHALKANTTGNWNIAIGASAMIANTKGTSNIAIGVETLNANTTGEYNVAVGHNALLKSITASNNVAFGISALEFTTTGESNTAIGNNSLEHNTTGAHNAAVGKGTLQTATTGERNTAVGYASLTKLETAVDNVAVGAESLEVNKTGHFNTAVGSNALINTEKEANTALGYKAGRANTTGEGNTFLGYKAGDEDGTTVTASGLVNVTCIGYKAQATVSNVIVLGGSISESRASMILGGAGTEANLGKGRGVFALANAVTVPSANYPSEGGGQLYAKEGKLFWRGGKGTVKEIAGA